MEAILEGILVAMQKERAAIGDLNGVECLSGSDNVICYSDKDGYPFFLLYKNEADREIEIKVEERQFVVAGSRFTLGLDNTS